jgi:hypothetical protein
MNTCCLCLSYAVNRSLVRYSSDRGSYTRCRPFYFTRPSKGKGKDHTRSGHGGPEGEKRYSCTLSLTSAQIGGWVFNATPRKETRYPLYRILGGLQGRSGRVRKISSSPRFDLQTIQYVASRYTD